MLERIQDATADIFYDMFTDVGHMWDNLLSHMKELFLRSMAEMAAQATVKMIVQPAISGIGGWLTGGGGGLGSIMSAFSSAKSLAGLFGGGGFGEYGLDFSGGLTALAGRVGALAGGVGAGLALFNLIDSWASKPSPYTQYLTFSSPEGAKYLQESSGVSPAYQRAVTTAFGTTVIGAQGRHQWSYPSKELVDHIASLITQWDQYFAEHLSNSAKQALTHFSAWDDWKHYEWDLGDAATMQQQIAKWFADFYQPFFESLNQYADDLVRELSRGHNLDEMMAKLGTYLTVAEEVGNFWDRMAELSNQYGMTLEKAADTVVSRYNEMVAFLSQAAASLTMDVANQSWQSFQQAFMQNIKQLFGQALWQEMLGQMVKALAGGMMDQITDLVDQFNAGTLSAEQLSAIIASLGAELSDQQDIWESFIKVLKEAGLIVESITNAWPVPTTYQYAIPDAGEILKGWTEQYVDSVREAVRYIVDQLQGMINEWASVSTTAGGYLWDIQYGGANPASAEQRLRAMYGAIQGMARRRTAIYPGPLQLSPTGPAGISTAFPGVPRHIPVRGGPANPGTTESRRGTAKAQGDPGGTATDPQRDRGEHGPGTDRDLHQRGRV